MARFLPVVSVSRVEPARPAFTVDDERFMSLALDEARLAAEAGDVPVGAVLVRYNPDGTETVVSRGHNTREKDRTALGHAEINAIDNACHALGTWRLSDCTLYVTLEPCPMCAGAILGGRIGRVVCGCRDAAAGAMGSVWALHRHPVQTVPVNVEFGCLENECREVLQSFFRARRKDNIVREED